MEKVSKICKTDIDGSDQKFKRYYNLNRIRVYGPDGLILEVSGTDVIDFHYYAENNAIDITCKDLSLMMFRNVTVFIVYNDKAAETY